MFLDGTDLIFLNNNYLLKMRMKEILGKLSKETRCYIMSALLFFEGFDQIDDFSEYRVKMSLDVLGLSRIDMECF